jgi:hypothetical protein
METAIFLGALLAFSIGASYLRYRALRADGRKAAEREATGQGDRSVTFRRFIYFGAAAVLLLIAFWIHSQ